MSAVNSLIQPLAAMLFVATAMIALADGKTALEIKQINIAAEFCLKQILTRNDKDAKFTYEFYTDPALRKVKYVTKDKSGTMSVGGITAEGCRLLDAGILTEAIKCAQEKFQNAIISAPTAKNVAYETFGQAYAKTPCTFATVPEAALECLRSLANAGAIEAGFEGVNIPPNANKGFTVLANYSPRFEPVYNSKKKWQKKFTIQLKGKGGSIEFKVAVSDASKEQCPSLNYNDLTKIHNCMTELLKGSSGQLEDPSVKPFFTYDELETVFRASSKIGAAVASCK